MIAEKLVVMIGVTALAMLSPGPDMVLVMRNTLTRDRTDGGLTALGVLSGNLVHIAYCVLGLAVLLAHSPIVYAVLRLASAAYLVYLGIQSLRSSHHVALESRANQTSTSRGGSAYRQGLINNLLNPKGVLFYLGVFSQLITPGTTRAEIGWLGAASLGVSAAFWAGFVFALDRPFVRTAFDRHAVGVERALGLVLVLLGVTVALTSSS